MHLVIEKYRNEQSITQPPDPILVPFLRNSRECVVSAIMEFISYNFIMDSPPKYRDSEGDMILLETREAFETAFDDVMQTPLKLFVVHIDGFYNFGLPKKQDTNVFTAEQASSSSFNTCARDGMGAVLMDQIIREIKQEVNKQIACHPVINKLKQFMAKFKEQKTYAACCSEQKSTQTDMYDATVGSSSLAVLESQRSSKIAPEEDDFTVFQLVDESPVWDVKAIYERKTLPLTKWENPSSSDLVKTVREGEGIFSKRWVLRRFACRRWENVSIISETIPDMLEIYRSKITVTNLPESGQVVDFTVWVKCSASTGYFCASWRLHKIIEDGRNSIPEGPRLVFEIFVNPFTDENLAIGRSAFSKELDSFSYYTAVRDEEQTIDDTRELEELTSSGSISASDYEVIDGGDALDDSKAK
ncbi:Uncharacterized protein BM_BM11046 [Brugia malayi]|uniref:Bm11046, isoform a n=1 Tax=Brugia malayi TaxID=6279 RepID=A0A0J9Y7N7_BRUMA|nr:Uncharacterized protein BM_BM11046 [Brugia malayi]CDQ04031.2 Bm11046, isoform b [Brugia malayi]VIO94872.1 Uncharacterized protein BM_BM11046 [Brugia malayi]